MVWLLCCLLLVPTTAAASHHERPAAYVTPSGVVVAVTASSSNGAWILTPCGRPGLVSQGLPISSATVVIDPGHGGETDTGAVGITGKPEKELNLEVAERVAWFLELRGIDSVLTRTADYASRLWVRANLADRLNARVMVSIHHNAPTPAPSRDPGIEVFVQKGSAESQRLGGILWEEAREGIGRFDIDWVAAEDSGVMTVLSTRGDDAYGIIRHPVTTTALVELGYISNPAEARLHQRPAYVWMAAHSVAQAIERFLESDDQGSGFVGGRVFNPRPGIGTDACVDPPLG